LGRLPPPLLLLLLLFPVEACVRRDGVGAVCVPAAEGGGGGGGGGESGESVGGRLGLLLVGLGTVGVSMRLVVFGLYMVGYEWMGVLYRYLEAGAMRWGGLDIRGQQTGPSPALFPKLGQSL
jgi:hypothetical protein